MRKSRLAQIIAAASRALAWLSLVGLLSSGAIAWAQERSHAELIAEVQRLAQQATLGTPLAPHRGAPSGARVEVELGQLDARLKLAPCAKITPYMPANSRPWGATRLGLRCTDGARWNVYMPITVKVFAQAPAAALTLPMGTVLTAEHLTQSQVDLAAEPSPVIGQLDEAIGRTLTRPLHAGQAIRQAHLKPRQWFAAGELVRIVTAGPGYSISAQGVALMAGIEGQTAKVRAESGRIVSGRPNGQRQIEVLL